MARASKEQMERNRRDIIKTSSQLFRERGLNGVSVNDIMAAVGLTHGGFYGHFSSKDELEALACRQAFDDTRTVWEQSGINTFQQLVEQYLSVPHRNATASGCTIAALAGDVVRKESDKPVCETYMAGVKQMLDRLQSVPGNEGDPHNPDKHLAQLALMAGALMLSRATEGDPLSEQFLAAAKEALLTPSS